MQHMTANATIKHDMRVNRKVAGHSMASLHRRREEAEVQTNL